MRFPLSFVAGLDINYRQLPIFSLRHLDLSGCKLGHQLCATIFATIYGVDSAILLESLDLSDNSIGKGSEIVKILRDYCDRIHAEKLDGYSAPTVSLKKSLVEKLNLASNNLCSGYLATEIFLLLGDGFLNFKSLNLSDNEICGEESSADRSSKLKDILSASIGANASLIELDLSHNKFSNGCIANLFDGIKRGYSTPAFLHLDGNIPTLDRNLLDELRLCMHRARVHHLNAFSTHNAEMPESCNPNFGPPSIVEHKVSYDSEQSSALSDVSDCKKPCSASGTITVLFSAPLVDKSLRSVDLLDLESEREHLLQCFKEASVDIDVSFDTATVDIMKDIFVKGSDCLHYSGHGHPDYLVFEDDCGGSYEFTVDELRRMMQSEDGFGAPFKFVFVSACHSLLAGQTFVKAGVPHVVCCKHEAQIIDSAALAFT